MSVKKIKITCKLALRCGLISMPAPACTRSIMIKPPAYMYVYVSWILHTTRQSFAMSKLEQVRSHLSQGKTVGRVKWELHLLLWVTSFCYINCMLSCLLWCSWEEATRGKKLPQFLSAYFHSPVLLWGKVRWARCLHRSSTELAVCVVCPQPAFRSCELRERERAESFFGHGGLALFSCCIYALSFLSVLAPWLLMCVTQLYRDRERRELMADACSL